MCYYGLIAYCILAVPAATLASEQPCNKPLRMKIATRWTIGPLRVQRIRGTAVDFNGVVIPGACILLFSESGHKFIASVESGKDGGFALSDVSPGAYRLVSRYDNFSVANARVDVGRFSGRRALVVRMRPVGIDTGSYIELR